MRRRRHFSLAIRLCAWAFLWLLLFITAHHATTGFALESVMEADWMGLNEQHGAEFGFAVAAAGDVNGDHYDDVVIGAPRHDGDAYRAGIAVVYAGSPSGLAAEPTWIVPGDQTGARLGAAVAGGGDLNRDGYADILLGAPQNNDPLPGAGRAQIHFGSPAGPAAAADWSIDGTLPGCRLGESVALVGDVNRDGHEDVLVGAPWCDDGDERIGRALLFPGGPSGPAEQPAATLFAPSSADGFGSRVAAAGDVNGDGYDDILVGAPYFESTLGEVGAAYLFLGVQEWDALSSPAWSFIGDSEAALVGAALSGVGDINADGYADFLVGAPGEEDASGAVYLFLGSPSGPGAQPSRRIAGVQPSAQFGAAVGSAGDIDRDGFADALIGAPFYSDDQNQEGAVFLHFGSPAAQLSAGAYATGDKAETRFGASLGYAGDVNRDEFDDLLVGAPSYRQGTIIVGRAFGYHGPIASSAAYQIFLPLLSSRTP